MKLAKIKNRYIFHSENPNGYHTYLVYYDKRDKKNYAITTTHLYKADPKRMGQVRDGKYKKVKLPGFELPSGVYHKPNKTTAWGSDIDIHSKDVHLKQTISKSKAKSILRFINGKSRK